MIAQTLLDPIARVEIMLTVIALAIVFGRGFWTHREQARDQRWLASTQPALALLVATADEAATDPEALSALMGVPIHVRRRLLIEMGIHVQGEARECLRSVARELGVTEAAERQSRSRWWWKRLRGARTLTVTDGNPEVLLRLLHDRDRSVRAQAIEWSVDHPRPAVIAELLSGLADGGPIATFHIPDALRRMGHHVIGPVRDALASTSASPTLLVALLRIAAGVPDLSFAAGACALCHHPDADVRAQAVALLGALGGEMQAEAVVALLGDDAPLVRTAVARAIATLQHWPAAPALLTLLHDPVWAVRREAGLALLSLGSVGIVYLRQVTRTETDSVAADMARQVLDLPQARQIVAIAV